MTINAARTAVLALHLQRDIVAAASDLGGLLASWASAAVEATGKEQARV